MEIIHAFDVPWGREQSGFTLLFEAFVMAVAKVMPVSRIGRLVREHDRRIWRIVRFYVGRAHAKKSYAAVTDVGCDETSSGKGHNYVMVFADMGTGEVMFATGGKDSGTVKAFAEALPKHAALPGQIKEVTIDMSAAFTCSVGEHLPQANITFDKFHVIQALNKAQDEVRRTERKLNPLLVGSRYIWLKNPENLMAKQKELLETLRYENLKTAKVYQMKMDLSGYIPECPGASRQTHERFP